MSRQQNGSAFFNSIEVNRPKRNTFNLSHSFKFSGNMGDLIPTLALEVIPGDKFKIGCKSLTRFMPMTSPVMHHMEQKMEYFFVPNRLLWENWENFITPGRVETLPAFPVLSASYNGTGYTKLDNYLGVPNPSTISVPDTTEVYSALSHAAYQFVVNEFYRNEQIDAEINYKLVDGTNDANPDLRILRKRGWKKDYYTSALPSAQAGPAVDIPLGDVALKDDTSDFGLIRRADNHNPAPGAVGAGAGGELEAQTGIPPYQETVYDPNGTLQVDPVTISTLRRAFKLQEWLERAMRGGKRYVESIYSFFGVKSPDSRFQRPEYITGIKTNVQVSEVLNTTGTDDLPQGNMSGHGIAVISEDKYGSFFAPEHGFIIGLCSLVPRPAYFQGFPKHLLKFVDPYQYYWEQFAHIGEQEILNKEVYAFTSTGSGTFGYTPRYVEYKQLPDRIAGQMQSTLLSWTLAREFATDPTLSPEFIHIDPATTDRIFAVTDPDEDKLIFTIHHIITASRQMPVFGNPQM